MLDHRQVIEAASARLLRLPEVRSRVGLSTSTIYKYMSEGTFPYPVKIGARTVAWNSTLIDRWIAERTNENHQEAAA